MSFALRTIVCNYTSYFDAFTKYSERVQYAVNRSKHGPGGHPWQEELVMQMNNAMTEWVDSVPEHREFRCASKVIIC